jgi:hypothetical protein
MLWNTSVQRIAAVGLVHVWYVSEPEARFLKWSLL